MTGCREFLDLISASLDQPLSSDEQTRLERHLSDCPECRSAQQDLKWTHAQLQNLEKAEPPPWLASKIMARIRAEAVPRASFWHRFIRPIVLKPQLQVASLLLLAATGFYLLRSQRSEQEVLFEMKQRKAPQPSQSQPSTPQAARDQLAPEPRNAPAELKKSQPGSDNQLRLEDSKAPGNAFAPPPPSAPAAISLDPSKEERSRAIPEPPRPSETPKPSPLAGAAAGGIASVLAESAAAPVRQAKKASNSEEKPARADEDAQQNSLEASGQPVHRPAAKDKLDAATWTIRLKMADPGSAQPLIERELARMGVNVLPQRESGASRVLWVRLDPHQLPQLLSRLARLGKVLEHPEIPGEKPSQITLSIRW